MALSCQKIKKLKITKWGVIFIEEKEIIVTEDKENIVQDKVDNIKNLIYCIRGKQVMLDRDVAMLYHYETKRINETVRRNIRRFPSNFCFQLNKNEYENLKSQIATSNIHGGKQKLPYVFTEKGILMLAGLLKNAVAVEISIKIVEAFVEMRKFITLNGRIFNRLLDIEYELDKQGKAISNHQKNFEKIFKELEKNHKEEVKQSIFFEGQIWDSYILIIDIIKRAKSKIVIIDNYIDDSILSMLAKKNKNVEVIIITSERAKIDKLDVKKFNEQYPILKITYTNKFHDRFIVIDSKELYHIGASLKDLGKKCFGINKIEDEEYIEKINKFAILD